MKRLLYLVIALSSHIVYSQTSEDSLYIDFLQASETRECLNELNSAQVSELFKANIIFVNNHQISMERNPRHSRIIDPFGLCNEYRSISLHHHVQDSTEHMFVYRRYSEARDNYGELQLYSKINGTWEKGQILHPGWSQFFSISNEEIDRLRNLNQYPTFLVTFRENGVEFIIPWEIYSFDQGSEMNGYVKGNGSQPIVLTYDNLLP